MAVLIGGSPSTGSSLLRRMLHRHPQVFCGSETSLFAKVLLYNDWNAHKSRLFKPSLFGLPSAGWHRFIGIEVGDDYGWDRKALKALVNDTKTDFVDFTEKFYKPILDRTSKAVWIEKTPANAYTLKHFLAAFPDGKVIHIVRHPLDVIASLYNRGKSLYDAVSLVLLNAVAALEKLDDPNYFLVSYEDLVMKTSDTLSELCSFLGVEYDELMLQTDMDEGGVTRMTGWNYDETAPVEQGSIGRFFHLDESIRAEIINRCYLMKQRYIPTISTVADLCLALDYQLPQIDLDITMVKQIEQEIITDIQARHFSRAFFRKPNYPIYCRNDQA